MRTILSGTVQRAAHQLRLGPVGHIPETRRGPPRRDAILPGITPPRPKSSDGVNPADSRFSRLREKAEFPWKRPARCDTRQVGADDDSPTGRAAGQAAAVDLYWLPLGAGGHFV